MPEKNTNLRNDLADAFGTIWDGATLEIVDDQGTVLVSYTLPTPAFDDPSTGTVALLGVPNEETASQTGVADHAILTNSDESRVLDDITIGTSDAMIIINNPNIITGQVVEIQSFTWTESAGFTN